MSLGKKLFIGGGGGGGTCFTDSVQPFGADSAYSSNVALYQLNSDGGTTNNVPDTVGNYNGTASNVTYSTGKFGNAAVFDGSSSYIQTSLSQNSDNIAISFWMQADATGGAYPILMVNNRNGIIVPYAYGTGSNSLTPNTQNQNILLNSTTLTSQLNHIVINMTGWASSYTAGAFGGNINMEVFVNGNSIGTTTNKPYGLSDGTRLGRSNGSYYFDGVIDQVRIYDKALSSIEVGVLYNETTSTASNTNVLGEGSGVALYSLDYDASDTSGNYNGSANSNVTFGVEGKINTAADFTGGGVVTVPNNVIYGDNHSVSVWFKLDNTSGYQGIFDFDYNNRIIFRVASSDANQANIGTSGWFAHNINFSANQWYHLVVTFSNGNPFKIYVNGNIAYTGGNSSLNAQLGDNNFGAGNASGVHSVNGNIDQLRIFRKELSAIEVEALYEETACVYTSTTDIVNYQGTNLAYYKLDNTAEDETGNYDGTESNITYEFGRYGQAAVFNGSNSGITTGLGNSQLSVSSAWSCSCWIYSSSFSNATNILGMEDSASPYSGWSLYQSTSAGLQPMVNGNAVGTAKTLTANQWYNVVLTYSGTVLKFYVDGTQIGSDVTISISTPSSNFDIGNLGIYNVYSGKVDQVRIYNSELDATAVENLYNEKPETDTSNFKTVLYEGNGSSKYVSNVGFQPDFVWIKNRDTANAGLYFDSVRGVEKYLRSDGTNGAAAEVTLSGAVSSFDSNGFTHTSIGNGSVNRDGDDYVAWCWKGGGDAVLNQNGNINSQVSANQDAGFSIVKWTSTGSGGATKTVGHGLSSTPEMIILKNASSSTANWRVYHNNIPSYNNSLTLNSTEAAYSFWPSVSSTNFGLAASITTGESAGASGQDIIAYCFHSVAGYQKLGSYSGQTGSVSVTTGFQPTFVLIKKTNTSTNGDWSIFDSNRMTSTTEGQLFPSSNLYEHTRTGLIDFDSNGFTINNNTVGQVNTYGDSYIYLAIA